MDRIPSRGILGIRRPIKFPIPRGRFHSLSHKISLCMLVNFVISYVTLFCEETKSGMRINDRHMCFEQP